MTTKNGNGTQKSVCLDFLFSDFWLSEYTGQFIIILINRKWDWFYQFEKRTTLERDIWEKTKWDCGLVWRAMFKNFFANISAHGAVVSFSNQFLHWNCGMETVVLRTIKCPNEVFKNWKNLPTSLKSGLKNPKLWEN